VDWDDRERLARTCRASVVEQFAIEAARQKYFDVFRRLATERSTTNRGSRAGAEVVQGSGGGAGRQGVKSRKGSR